jgi:predicted transcriptional regulator
MGYVIPERRGELELSLSALAKRLGLTRPYVAYLQAGSGQTSLTFSSAVYLSY